MNDELEYDIFIQNIPHNNELSEKAYLNHTNVRRMLQGRLEQLNYENDYRLGPIYWLKTPCMNQVNPTTRIAFLRYVNPKVHARANVICSTNYGLRVMC